MSIAINEVVSISISANAILIILKFISIIMSFTI